MDLIWGAHLRRHAFVHDLPHELHSMKVACLVPLMASSGHLRWCPKGAVECYPTNAPPRRRAPIGSISLSRPKRTFHRSGVYQGQLASVPCWPSRENISTPLRLMVFFTHLNVSEPDRVAAIRECVSVRCAHRRWTPAVRGGGASTNSTSPPIRLNWRRRINHHGVRERDESRATRIAAIHRLYTEVTSDDLGRRSRLRMTTLVQC